MSEEALNPLAVDLEEFRKSYLDPWIESMRPKWEQAANEWDAKIAAMINEKSEPLA